MGTNDGGDDERDEDDLAAAPFVVDGRIGSFSTPIQGVRRFSAFPTRSIDRRAIQVGPLRRAVLVSDDEVARAELANELGSAVSLERVTGTMGFLGYLASAGDDAVVAVFDCRREKVSVSSVLGWLETAGSPVMVVFWGEPDGTGGGAGHKGDLEWILCTSDASPEDLATLIRSLRRTPPVGELP